MMSSTAFTSTVNNPSIVQTQSISAEQRMQEQIFFTPECRRLIYNILCKIPRASLFNSSMDTASAIQSSKHQSTTFNGLNNSSARIAGGVGTTGFRTANSNISIQKKNDLKWNFKPGPSPMGSPQGFISLVGSEFITITDNIEHNNLDFTLQAIDAIGQANEGGMAVTEAFEKLLVKEYIPWWTEKDLESLPLQFIMSFNRILSPSLNITHIIRSKVFKKSELLWLSSLSPTIIGPLNTLLQQYQPPPTYN